MKTISPRRILAAILLLAALPIGVLAAELSFTDVPKSEWYYEDVRLAVEGGLVNGKSPTIYAPNDNVTYAETVKLAACIHKLTDTGSTEFAAGTVWYQPYVDYARSKQIISKDYDWNTAATRAHFMDIFKSFSPASCRKCLAREASAQEVKVGEFFGVNGSCVGIVDFLLSGRVDGAIAGVCIFVDFAMPNTLKSACQVQACPETADAREHIKISDYTFSFLHLLLAARAKSRERHRRRSRLAAAAKLFVDGNCFAAPFGELLLSPSEIAPAVPAGTAPDRASSCAARQGWQTEAPTPAGAEVDRDTVLRRSAALHVSSRTIITAARRNHMKGILAGDNCQGTTIIPMAVDRTDIIDKFYGSFRSRRNGLRIFHGIQNNSSSGRILFLYTFYILFTRKHTLSSLLL